MNNLVDIGTVPRPRGVNVTKQVYLGSEALENEVDRMGQEIARLRREMIEVLQRLDRIEGDQPA